MQILEIIGTKLTDLELLKSHLISKYARSCVNQYIIRINAFLNYLDKIQVSIGTHIEIVDVNDFDHSIDVKIDGTHTHISLEVAQNILICVL